MLHSFSPVLFITEHLSVGVRSPRAEASKYNLRPDAGPWAQHRREFSPAQKNFLFCYKNAMAIHCFLFPWGQNVTFFFQFAKTKKDGKRAQRYRWFTYLSPLLVTTPPEGTRPLLIFLFLFFSCCVPGGTSFVFLHDKLTHFTQRGIVSLRGETCLPPSITHTHTLFIPSSTRTVTSLSVSQTVVRGCSHITEGDKPFGGRKIHI